MQGQVITVNRFCFYILFMALTIIRSYKGKSTLSSRLQYPHRVLTLCCGGMDCTQFVWAFPSDLLAVLWVHFNINCKFVSVLCFNVSVIKPFFSLHMMIFCVIIAFVFSHFSALQLSVALPECQPYGDIGLFVRSNHWVTVALEHNLRHVILAIQGLKTTAALWSWYVRACHTMLA